VATGNAKEAQKNGTEKKIDLMHKNESEGHHQSFQFETCCGLL
jgi:hypothetical protein